MRRLLAAVAISAVAAAITAAPSRSTELSPDALARAGLIGRQTTSHYSTVAGRKLYVGEPARTGVVETLTLLTDEAAVRVVPADNGIYYALCNRRGLSRPPCGYPIAKPWGLLTLLPRLIAVELAIRTFEETTADLVVVALPTLEPTWVIFEREEFFLRIDTDTVWRRLIVPLDDLSAARALVDEYTTPRLYEPIPLLSPGVDTLFAASLWPPVPLVRPSQ